MSGRGLAVALVATVAAGLAACSGEAESKEPKPAEAVLEGCGPLSYDDVAGRAPSYVDGPLDSVPNDHAMCAAAWLPRTGTEFVPQGLVVRGHRAWVSGYDYGRTPFGSDSCRIIRVDLRTGEPIAQRSPIEADLAPREPAVCRHGGGLALDEHGLWVSQRTKIWLLDPEALTVIRVWHLIDEVWGSFLVQDDAGRLGVGGFSSHHRTTLHWFEPAVLFEPGRLDITPDDAADVQVAPKSGQGALWADLGPGEERVWFTRSNTHCSELWARPRLRFAFLPGAEGVAYARGRVWVVSETTAAPYFLDGGRPVVPTLAQYDVRDFPRWERSACGA